MKLACSIFFAFLVCIFEASAMPTEMLKLQPPVKAQWVGIFIGNPCEVITTGSHPVIRDFYENGITSPYVGTETSSRIGDLKKSNVATTGVSMDILARKMADLEKIHPDLPSYLIKTMNSYNWVMLDAPLGLVPEDSGAKTIDPARRQTLANRYLKTIRISRPAWNRLDEVQQVAAILHETFFSLVKLEFLNPTADTKTGVQKSVVVKELIANLFTPNIPSIKIKNQIANGFSVPISGALLCEESKTESYFVSLSLFETKGLVGENSTQLWHADISSSGSLQELTSRFCFALQNFDSTNNLHFQIKASRPVIGVTENLYTSVYGQQIALTVKNLNPFLLIQMSPEFRQINECEVQIFNLIQDWQFDRTPFPKQDHCTDGRVTP